jgi:hypothetical protein
MLIALFDGLRELMDRLGRSRTRATLIYQRSSDERQRELADAVSKLPARRSARQG